MTTEKPASMTVPRDPMVKLREVSAVRASEIFEASGQFACAERYMRAAAYAALATMENDTLRKLLLMVKAQLEYEELAAEMAVLAKTVGALGEALACKTIPDVMDQAEMEEFTLTGGRKVVIDEKVHAQLKKEDREKGCALLEKKGFASLVKRTITVPFTTKQGALADKVKKAMERALGADFAALVEDERNVHHSTLAKWVRECLADGTNLTTEEMKLFGVHRQRRAVITDRKED
jgi:hypothetical protein